MGIKVFEGVVERKGAGTVTGGRVTDYTFIEIGGQRIMKVQAPNLMDTFLRVGDNVAISCLSAGWGNGYKIQAIREPDGRITKMGLDILIVASAVIYGCWVVLLLLPMIFALGIMAPVNVFCILLGVPLVLTYFCMRNGFRSRNALDGYVGNNPPVG